MINRTHMDKGRSYLAIGLWFLCTLLANLAVQDNRTRWDFTDAQRHTLSQTSIDHLKRASSPIQVRAFLPSDLPPKEHALAQAMRDAFSDYQAHSQVPFSIEILDPSDPDLTAGEKAELDMEAESYGLEKRVIEIVEEDRRSQQETWFDVIFLYQDRQVIMPRIETPLDVEYGITRALKTVLDERHRPPVIGFSIGHGEPPILRSPLRPNLDALGDLEGVPLDGNSIPTRIDVLVILGPTKPFNERVRYTLDQFLVRGGTLVCFLDYRAQSRQFPELLLSTAPGLNTLLTHYGMDIEITRTVVDQENPANAFIANDPSGKQTVVAHPLHVYAQPTENTHPITQGIQDVVVPMSSHMDLNRATEMGYQAIPLLVTSDRSTRRLAVNKVSPKAYADQVESDELGPAVVGAIVSGPLASAYKENAIPEPPKSSPFAPAVRNLPFISEHESHGRIMVVTSGTRMLAALQNGQLLLENAIEWASTENALSELRSRRARTPRLDDLSAETRTQIRIVNILGPTLLLLSLGYLLRIRRRRS